MKCYLLQPEENSEETKLWCYYVWKCFPFYVILENEPNYSVFDLVPAKLHTTRTNAMRNKRTKWCQSALEPASDQPVHLFNPSESMRWTGDKAVSKWLRDAQSSSHEGMKLKEPLLLKASTVLPPITCTRPICMGLHSCEGLLTIETIFSFIFYFYTLKSTYSCGAKAASVLIPAPTIFDWHSQQAHVWHELSLGQWHVSTGRAAAAEWWVHVWDIMMQRHISLCFLSVRALQHSGQYQREGQGGQNEWRCWEKNLHREWHKDREVRKVGDTQSVVKEEKILIRIGGVETALLQNSRSGSACSKERAPASVQPVKPRTVNQ